MHNKIHNQLRLIQTIYLIGKKMIEFYQYLFKYKKCKQKKLTNLFKQVRILNEYNYCKVIASAQYFTFQKLMSGQNY